MSQAPDLHPPTLWLAVCDVPPESLVTVAGELDLASAPALGNTLRRLDPGCEVVTLDLRARGAWRARPAGGCTSSAPTAKSRGCSS